DKRAEEAKKAFDTRDAHWEKALGSVSDRYARYYLALQKEAEKVDPQAVVMGYAYANYAKPPLQTKLNSRVIIGIVPSLMYPWTAEKRRAFIEQWNGWSAAGARLLLRPNYMLDGHCLPIHFARALGQDFSFAIQHGLIGTDFDSLTGQWSTQGPNLYVLARLHAAPSLTVEQCLDEYSAGFGKATRAVRAYFAHWESVSNSVTPEAYKAADLHWSRFHRDADAIFTPEVMRRGRELLDQALAAAKGDADAEARMAFLDKGLRNAELTLATQQAYRGYRASGELDPYVAALEKLDSYRASVEGDFVANMAYLAWSETYTWDRDLIRMMRQPGARLPDPWKFMWDPDKVGERDRWFDEDFDAARWHDISTTGSWEMQEIGRQWKEAHKEDYNGIAWYRTSFKASQPEKPARIQLVFGAVDEACKIWLNGRLALERPYPYKGNPDSWRESFELDITSLVRYDKPNVLAVRVEDNAGAGGIWRPVWLTTAESPATDQKNAVKDGGFESQPPAWQQHVQGGRFKFAIDTTQKRSGNASALLECLELAAPDVEQRIRAKSWARWYQAAVPVAAGKAHQFRVWYRTDVDFRGTVKVWVTATEKQTMEAKGLNTRGLWRELRIEGIKSPTGQVSVYLNVMDGTGKVWFDDVELSESPG
ncbi:MAG: DUF4838 domain-containing protein, partial [Planctomycetes bacterium]|nr:DUF4838 domain-containing protein [Planctomycetota bacterium]